MLLTIFKSCDLSSLTLHVTDHMVSHFFVICAALVFGLVRDVSLVVQVSG